MIIATTHKNTDFDGLASVIAATLLYPGCVGVVPKMTNRNVNQFLSTHKTAFNLILPHEVDAAKIEKLIVLDTDQWHRLDRMEKLAARQGDGLRIEVWDHHMGSPGDIQADWICKERIGATISMLVREMRRRGMTLSPLDSTVLLIGLYEDTGHLAFPSTTAEDAQAAAYLLENRADLNVASFFLNPPYEENQKEILFEMMKETEKWNIGGNSVGFNVVNLDKKVTNLAAVVSMYRKIINVDALFVVFSSGDRHTIIGRSGTENVNVGELLRCFGGGGHGGAGSATVRDGDYPLQLIKQSLVELLRNNGTEKVTIADIMSFPVVSVPSDTPISKVRAIMNREKIRGIMVVDAEEICGIIVLWDLKKIKKESQWKSPVKAFMTRKVITIGPQTSPTEAARLMIEKDVGYLPVVHEGKMIGIVTRTDILTYYYDLLPE